MDDRRISLTDATFALSSVAVDAARVPLQLARWLPGMRRIAADGAFARARLQSRMEGLAERGVHAVLASPAFDRVRADVREALFAGTETAAARDDDAPPRIIRSG